MSMSLLKYPSIVLKKISHLGKLYAITLQREGVCETQTQLPVADPSLPLPLWMHPPPSHLDAPPPAQWAAYPHVGAITGILGNLPRQFTAPCEKALKRCRCFKFEKSKGEEVVSRESLLEFLENNIHSFGST